MPLKRATRHFSWCDQNEHNAIVTKWKTKSYIKDYEDYKIELVECSWGSKLQDWTSRMQLGILTYRILSVIKLSNTNLYSTT
jgi:hypothetical protein